MSKFKQGFVRGVKKEEAYQREQRRLKEKHEITDPDVVVVEKDNMWKFLIRFLAGLIRMLAAILLLTLASVGLLAIVYPSPRAELLQVLSDIIRQIFRLLGIG